MWSIYDCVMLLNIGMYINIKLIVSLAGYNNATLGAYQNNNQIIKKKGNA
jgi:hypothetical protein